MFTDEIGAKQVLVSLELRKTSLLLKLIADNSTVNGYKATIDKGLEEVKNRAAAIRCEVDLQAGDTFTAFTALIKQ